MVPRAIGWKISEDKVLCEARLVVSGDPETRVTKLKKFYGLKFKNAESNQLTDGVFRDADSCVSRWKKISKECMAYGAALRRAERTLPSGDNLLGVVDLADSYFITDNGRAFKLKHCWELVKNEPEFQHPPERESPVNLGEDDTPILENSTGSSSRPPGTKSKKAQNKKGSDSARRMEEYIAYAKARDADYAIDRAKELEAFQAAEIHAETASQRAEIRSQRAKDKATMQVDPTMYTPPIKRKYWQGKQKEIVDREMAKACSTPPSLTNTYESLSHTYWI